MNSRVFKSFWIMVLLASLTVSLCDAFSFQTGAMPLTQEQHDIMRALARNRSRRIIFNNDGCDATTSDFGRIDPKLWEGDLLQAFLNSRRRPPDNSQIDTLSYCTSYRGLATHRSNVQTEHSIQHSEENADLNLVPRMRELGTDPLREQTTLCRSRGIEIFHSMRMNDTHDAGYPDDGRFSDFKLAYPELLCGTRGEVPPYGQWSAMDFGSPVVRDFVYESLKEVAENYDVDGIEMDFFRHPLLFRSVALSGQAGAEERAALTELVVRIRAMLDETGCQRGRPFLLSIRAPDSAEYCREIGIDIEHWFELGLIDLYTAGGYFRLNAWPYSVALARRHDVRVYADLSESRIMDGAEKELSRTSMEAWRGRAMEAWNAGIDGVAPFNLSNAGADHYRELGGPDTLRGRDRLHCATVLYSSGKSLSNPGFWVKEGRDFVSLPILSPMDTVSLKAEEPVSIPFYGVADDLISGTLSNIPRVAFRVRCSRVCTLQGELNGHVMETPQMDGDWMEWPVAVEHLQPQVNLFEIGLTTFPGSENPEPVLILDAQIKVDGLIMGYNFTGGSGAASSVHSEISPSSIGREGGWNIAAGSGTLYIQNPTNVPTGAIDLGQYVSFEIDPLENTIDYDSVSFRLGGDNTTSSMDYTVTLQLRRSLDNYTSVLGTDSYTLLRNSGAVSFKTAKVIDLSGNSAFQGVGGTTTFRLYAYDDSNYNTTKLAVRLDDILVYGSVIAD